MERAIGSGKGPGPSGGPKWLFAALALAISATVGLAVLEVALRIYNPIYVPLRAYSIELPVNRKFIWEVPDADAKVDKVVTVQHNGLGFRGPEKGPDFDQRLTVVTVGGSTTFCVGLTDTHAWPLLVSKRLESRFPDLWLNNAGFDGHSTFGHLMLLDQALGALKPKVAVYLVGINDVGRGDLNDFDRQLHASHASGWSRIVRFSELLSTLQVLWRTLRAHRAGVTTYEPFELAKLPRKPYDEVADRDELARHAKEFVPAYRARLDRLIDETRAMGTVPIVVTQPALYADVVDPTTGVHLGEFEWAGKSSLLLWRLLEQYNDVTRQLAREKGVALVDLAARLDKDPRYYSDPIHYSIEGAQQVAAIVAEGIAPTLEKVRDAAAK